VKRIMCLVVGLCLIAGASLFAADKPTPPKNGTGGILVIGRGGDSVSLDPATVTDGESWRVAGEIIDTLVRLEGTSTKVIPWLAESWSTKDSKTWNFKIRKNVKFHDGTDCDAAAVKWNFDRWIDPNNQWRFGRTFEYFDNEFGKTLPIVSTKVVDTLTFQLTLAEPSAILLYKLPLFSFGIASPTAIQKQGAKYGTAAGSAVGTGPFIFSEWVPDDKIVLKANPNWWGKGPVTAGEIFRSIPDNSARMAELLAGTINTGDFAQTDMPAIEASPNVASYALPSLSVGYVAFQQSMKPFDNVKVRWAIAHAINRDAIVKAFYSKYDKVATSFQPPAILGSDPKPAPITYDPALAKKLLAEAGYPDGFSTEFWYIPVIRGYFPDSKAIAEAMSVDLAKVGIKVELKTEDWGAYLDHRSQGKFPMWMLGWGSDNGDPDNFLGWHFGHPIGKPNVEDSYANDKLAQLLIDGRKEFDVNKRAQLYTQAEKIIYTDMPRLPMAWVASRVFFTTNVKGYEPVNFRTWYEKVWVEKK
jgi:peptide/nickel transport system substrate-binding protein